MEPRIKLGSVVTVAGFTGTVISISGANGIQLRSEGGEVKVFSLSEVEKAAS